MITEDDMAGLSGLQPELQFRFIEQVAIKRLADRDEGDHPFWDDFDYMSAVLSAADVFGIDELASHWSLPSRGDENWLHHCRNFRAEATSVSLKIMFKYATMPEKDPNTVALDPRAKEKLRFHLSQVRSIIDKEPLPDWKKEDLLKVIAELETEIDKSRTRLAAVLEVLTKVWDGSELLSNAFRKVAIIVQDAKRAENEQAKLAAPKNLKRLEPPAPKKIEAISAPNRKSGFAKRIDDEIPF